jgi:hypothetical protein
MKEMGFIYGLPAAVRIVAILVLAVLAHFSVRGLKRLSQWLLSLKLKTETADAESFTRRYPKLATLTTIMFALDTRWGVSYSDVPDPSHIYLQSQMVIS